MCQEFVGAAIEPTRRKYPEVYVLHYMDDILISNPSEAVLLLILADLTEDLEAWGLCIAQKRYKKNASFSMFRTNY
jgi:hypothetical protein